MGSLRLIGFGPDGWGGQLVDATLMTIAVSSTAFVLGIGIGAVFAWAKLSGRRIPRAVAATYTTILRGVPELLVIYLFYFGGSEILTRIANWMEQGGFVGINAFATGALAVAIVSGAYQTEVIRGAVAVIPRGQAEAARSLGLRGWQVGCLVLAPQVLRAALPGMGNIWQSVLKESALISVTGLVELLHEVDIAGGSTKQPFLFCLTGAVIYLVITSGSGLAFRLAEQRSRRGGMAA